MNKDIEIVHGSGNVFRDFGYPNSDIEQTKSILAAKIIGVLDDQELSIRKAEVMTGVNHSEFARIRRMKLDRFTIDRLISILNRLNQRVEFDIKLLPQAEENTKPLLGAE